MAQIFLYCVLRGLWHVDILLTVDPLGQHVRAPSTAWPTPLCSKAEKEISPLRIWACFLPLFVCLSDHRSFRRDILIPHRVREVKPLRRVLRSSRNEYAYFKSGEENFSPYSAQENLQCGIMERIWALEVSPFGLRSSQRCRLLTLQTLSDDLTFSELSFPYFSKWPSSLPHRLLCSSNAIIYVK